MTTVLVVEDDTLLADCYQRWLAADGYQVVHCRDAQSALDAVDTARPDYILLDMLLPGANGVQFLQALKSHADLADIPVIVCTGANLAQMSALAAYGVQAVLNKPTLTRRSLRKALQRSS